MSTHASVRRPGGGGRYIHFDGYPSYTGRALWRLVKLFGLEEVRTVVIDTFGEWRCLDTDTDVDDEPFVYGYGQVYPDTDLDYWVDPQAWDYVLADLALRVTRASDGRTWVIPWSGDEPDWPGMEE